MNENISGTVIRVLFRLAGTDPDHDNRRILEVLESDTNWVGRFAVVTQRLIRIRPLPAPKQSG